MTLLAKLLIVIAFIAIVISLGTSLVFLNKDTSDKKRVVKGLTWRIGFSIALIIAIGILLALGVISPNPDPRYMQ